MSADDERVDILVNRLRDAVYKAQTEDVKTLLEILSEKPIEIRKKVLESRCEKNENKTILLIAISGENLAHKRANCRQTQELVTNGFPRWNISEKYDEIVEMLIDAGADTTACDDNGCDLFNHPREINKHAENLTILAKIPEDRLPYSLRWTQKMMEMDEKKIMPFGLRMQVLRTQYYYYVEAIDLYQARERKKEQDRLIQEAIEEDRRKRDHCETCGSSTNKKQKK